MRRFRVEPKNNDDGLAVAAFIPDPYGDFCFAADVQELADVTNRILCHAVHRHYCAFVRSPFHLAYSIDCTCGLNESQKMLEKLLENLYDD